MLRKLNINILGFISNNIFNVKNFDNSFFLSNKIDHLGTYEFDKNILDLNLDFDCLVTNKISKIIMSDV